MERDDEFVGERDHRDDVDHTTRVGGETLPDHEEHSPKAGEDFPDPYEIRRRHRRQRVATAGEVYLRTLSAKEDEWLWAMVRRVATAHKVDRDDLFQELRLAILRNDVLDSSREDLHGWLSQLAEWRALDMLRRELRHARRSCSLDHTIAELPAPEPVRPAVEWAMPQWWPLNRNETAAVLLLCWGLDLDLREFAHLVSRSHAAVRQDRSRGLRKVENLFGLSPEQRAALVAYRQHDDLTIAAQLLGLPLEQLSELVRSAQTKISRALGHAADAVPDSPLKEDTRDVRR